MSGNTTAKPTRRPQTKTERRVQAAQAKAEDQRHARRSAVLFRIGTVTLALVILLGGLYGIFRSSTDSAPTSSSAPGAYDVGQPAVGARGPDFNLAATTGGTINSADYRGKTVLLYFQEGLMCQPCWDQIRDLEKTAAAVKAAGVDEVVSITTDPINLVIQKVRDERLTTPVLSDPDLKVSRAYRTNEYGMMGTTRNGHSFVLLGPDGAILWRADYGGAPKYTMYVPVDRLLADLKSGRRG